MSLFEVLPAELIEQILRHLDPASFYVCLQTSPQFRQHALASINLLHEHLARIPGQRFFYPGISSNADLLLMIFSQRAAQHLFNGVEQMADVHVWRAPPSMDRKVSSIVPCGAETVIDDLFVPPKTRHRTLLFIEARSSEGLVNIYSIQDDGLTLKYVISPHIVSQHLPAYDEKGTAEYEVVKVASDTTNAVWYEPGPTLAVLYGPKHPPKDAVNIEMKVLCFSLDPEHGPMITSIYHVQANKASPVVAFALLFNGDPIIAYRVHHLSTAYNVNTYHNKFDELTLKWHTETNLKQPMAEMVPPEAPISAMSIQRRSIHLYPAAISMPHWTAAMDTLHPSRDYMFERRETYLPDFIEAFPRPSLGRVLATYHHHYIEDDNLNNGVPTCVNTALELMIAHNDWDSPFVGSTREGAYLLKAVQYPDSCVPFNEDEEYDDLHHVFVAQLVDPPLESLPSIGLKLAISPGSDRIAIANWRTLLIYALDPNAFLEPHYALFDGDDVPGDYAYLERCGWQYYQNGEINREGVVLKPVKLECEGVVFGLQWRSENELWGWTEEGIVRWKIGVDASGKRGKTTLEATHLECPTKRGEGRH